MERVPHRVENGRKYVRHDPQMLVLSGSPDLSGLNIAAPAQARDALSTTDFDGVMGWIDNYYRSNPLDPIIIAAKR